MSPNVTILEPPGASVLTAFRSVAFVAALSAATILYNIVDSPVGTIPVTHVDPELDGLTPEWLDRKVGTGHGSPILERLLYNSGSWSIYDAKKMAGLPVGVQVVGKKWEEEKAIEMMKVVDKALGKRRFGPGSWERTKQ